MRSRAGASRSKKPDPGVIESYLSGASRAILLKNSLCRPLFGRFDYPASDRIDGSNYSLIVYTNKPTL